MRLNDKDVRTKVIEHLEAVCPNKRNLPWAQDKLEAHRYLATLADINRLSYRSNQYKEFELKHWEAFKPLAEVAILPSRVVVMAHDYAVNLINQTKYQQLSDDYYTVKVKYKERENDDTTGESKLVDKEKFENRSYTTMNLDEFNLFTLKLIMAFKGNPETDKVGVDQYRKETLLSDVAEREIVGGKVIELGTFGIHLNTQSFISERYCIDADMAEGMAFTEKLAKWAKGIK
jgi:hypothetical protein